jgi:peptide/nickel transport system permease protein
VIRFAFKKLTGVLLSLVVLSVILFWTLSVLPGKASTAALGLNPTPEGVAAFNRRYGLDRPLITQYLDWIGGVVRGDFGRSYQTDVSITAEILARIPVTLELTIMATMVALLIGVPLAVIASMRPGSRIDVGLTSVSLLGLSMPAFTTATALVLVLSLQLHWLPTGGYVPLTEDPLGNIQMMLMPAVSLGLVSAGFLMRILRIGLTQSLGQEYALASRSRGASEWAVLRRHAIRVAAIPFITVGAMEVGAIFGGSVVIEQIFQLPGLGSFVLLGIQTRDFQVLQAATIVIAAFVMLANLTVDLVAADIDPRLREGVKG